MHKKLTKQVRIFTPESIVQFQDYLSGRGYSENTIECYGKDLRHFMIECDNRVDEEEYTEMAFIWLQKYRKVLSGKTTGRRLSSLKSFANWATIENNLKEYRPPRVAPPTPHPLDEGVEGVRRMIRAAACEEHKVLVGLCGLGGLRISEALSIGIDNISTERMRLHVIGKGDKERFVPISIELWNTLKPQYATRFIGSDPLPLAGRLTDRSARRAITIIGKRAGISRQVSSHDLRATFATAVYNKTKNSRIVQNLLGHANLSTTEIYLGIETNQIIQAVEL